MEFEETGNHDNGYTVFFSCMLARIRQVKIRSKGDLMLLSATSMNATGLFNVSAVSFCSHRSTIQYRFNHKSSQTSSQTDRAALDRLKVCHTVYVNA